MDSCFVIQPFDNDRFDNRYTDIFEPALKAANLNPYRVDKDYRVSIPIEAIESNIRKAKICFADITLDNPNVWYELGFAFACGKEVIMVCSDERTGKYPFDIQHKTIIPYKTGSTSDFNRLMESITTKAEALLQNLAKSEAVYNETISKITSPTSNIDEVNFRRSEIQIFRAMVEEQPILVNGVHSGNLQNRYVGSGYSEFEFGLASLKLAKAGFINRIIDDANYGYECVIYSLTDKGEEWILANEDLILAESPKYKLVNDDIDNDLPF